MSQVRVKYPRTQHVPSSPGMSADDVQAVRMPGPLAACPDVLVSVKVNGEATTGYADGVVHARSTTGSLPHPSRSWVRNRLAGPLLTLPPGWRVCGENVHTVHSIEYTAAHDLPDLFLVYSLWDARNQCRSWDETVQWAQQAGLATVPVIYRGPMLSAARLDAEFAPYAALHEGWVVRTAAGFAYSDFADHVAKWVRPGHVRTDEHWSQAVPRVNVSRATARRGQDGAALTAVTDRRQNRG